MLALTWTGGGLGTGVDAPGLGDSPWQAPSSAANKTQFKAVALADRGQCERRRAEAAMQLKNIDVKSVVRCMALGPSPGCRVGVKPARAHEFDCATVAFRGSCCIGKCRLFSTGLRYPVKPPASSTAAPHRRHVAGTSSLNGPASLRPCRSPPPSPPVLRRGPSTRRLRPCTGPTWRFRNISAARPGSGATGSPRPWPSRQTGVPGFPRS